MFVHKQSSKMFDGSGVCSSLYAINSVNNQLNYPIKVGLHSYLLSWVVQTMNKFWKKL